MFDDDSAIAPPVHSDSTITSESERAGRLQMAALIIVALASIGVGYVFGRTLRDQTRTPSVDFLEAESLALGGDGMPLGGAHPLVGEQAPEFTMIDLATGAPSSLADYAGNPLIVNFWATWCPPCRMEMPWLQDASDRYADQGLVVLALDAGERVPPSAVEAEIRAFVDLMGLTFPVLYGPEADSVQQDWMVWGLPSTFLVDRTGRVMDVQIGMYSSQSSLDERLVTLLGDDS